MSTLGKQQTAKFFKCRSLGMNAAGKDSTLIGDTFIELWFINQTTFQSEANSYNALEEEADNSALTGTDLNNNNFGIAAQPTRPRPGSSNHP